ncbi:PR-1-like protein [Lophiostoma macrostomum CBS 122681]|uniref:PR-1-like protein n=1 Tax=Lophiostoma macrostomum CBS 122681 TaxID=1314788 RepID=A0A6A6T0C1_9PLEO|nr:PR-1-like protein [Lophiostoma macrostomum CBS 122681]
MKLPTLLALALGHLVVASPTKRNQVDGAAPKIDDPNFISRVMDAHWYWRRIHCAQDLTWDPALAQAAFDSVNACTEHPQHDRGGSNLSSMGPAPGHYDEWLRAAREMVQGWHEEELKYPYDNPTWDTAWGHFTQVVWRNTSHLGCAMAHCGDVEFPARLYCFYESPGNVLSDGMTEFKANVWPMVCKDPDQKRPH